ncbi:MAG: RNA polymerase sigma factor [Prevotella sp.]|nr:RNA polymerase sigma factor [Prevotella sp.]
MRTMSVAIAEQFGYAQDDAEDIAQDVMLKLWCLHEKMNDATHLKASVAITTRRVCIDKWRSTHILAEIKESMPVMDEDTQYDRLEFEELERWMDEQIDFLPSTSSIVLRMRQLEQRELSEIAEIIGIKQTSVSTLLSRARNELLKKLKRRNQQ